MHTTKKFISASATALLALGMAGGVVAPAQATITSETASTTATEGAKLSQKDRENLINVAKGLRAGDAPRDTEKTDQGTVITYHLQDGIDLAFVYDDDGNPIIAENLNDVKKTVTYVSGGADPFPYVDLDSAEQGAAAAGTASTLAGAICVALGPETAGVGCAVGAGAAATVIAVAASHGVCPDSQVMRIHVLSGKAECRS